MTKTKTTTESGAARPNILPSLEQRFGPVEYRPIGALNAYANNPRKHPEKQIEKIGASIGEFGFTIPVLIDEHGSIIAGEARVAAAKRIGLAEVPVLVARCWSAAQVKAYRLADNRLAEAAHWDNAALAIELTELIKLDEVPIEILGWETAETDLIIEGDKQAADAADPADEPVEPPVTPTARENDIWLLGKHRLLCSSSLDPANWTILLDGKIAAFVFEDPPYNVPIAGHVSGLGKVVHPPFAMATGEMSTDEFIQFLTDAIGAKMAHLKDGAVLDICMDWRHIGELLAALKANGLTVINLCVWNKTNGGMGSLYRSKHEMVVIAKKGKVPHTNNVQLGKYGRYRTNVWDYAGANSFGKNRMADLADHCTVKPVAMVADAILDVTKAGEIVLDGFLGSGATILAAERTKRICYGIEIEPRYIDVAIRRWEAMTGGKAVLASSGASFAEVAAARASENDSEMEPKADLVAEPSITDQ